MAHLEHHHDGAGGAGFQAERIAVAEARRGHLLLAITQRLDRADRVTQLRGLLKAFLAGGVEHVDAQALGQLILLTVHQQARLLHGAVVLLDRTHRVDARRNAPLDVVLQTRAIALAVDHFVA